MSRYLVRPDVVTLDGAWAFVLRPRPEDVTTDDLRDATDGWATVEVPGCWTMQGFDRPQYTNIAMPFPGPPPRVPDDNPTGVHRRRVTVPESWRGRRIVLHVAGAESVLYVHVDGVPVGMGKDSRLPSELDLTSCVEPGRPFDLALTVVRWSDATYLEDQDHWYHAGLHRGVLLYATPSVHVADLHTVADFDPLTGDGTLDVRVAVGAATGDEHLPRGWHVRLEVAGQEVEAPVRGEHPTNVHVNWLTFEGRGARATITVPGVAPWSAESPALHGLRVTLLDDGGAEVEQVSLDVGFRRVEVRGPELLVNGRAVLIKGVNRHDHDPRRGKAVTPASIEHDIVLMKQHNLNAVRTAHYPNDAHLYDVCDRLGMYVMDEADIESHAYLRSLTKDPIWASAILERVTRMALRDKDHACVIAWSLGNESGVSPAHRAAAAWLRAFDPSRPVHYESGITEDRLRGAGPDMAAVLARPRAESDLIAPMYPSVDDIVGWADRHEPDRPLIMCEYIHAMGNSCGGLDAYWDAIRTHRGLQGGFVWDWADQALVQELDDGSERMAYGGDFGDVPNDGPFCMNGLVAADRTPHPALLELAAVVQPVRICAIDASAGLLQITNEHDFVDLRWLQPSWDVTVDGVEVAAGIVAPLDLAPGASCQLRIPVPALELGRGARAHLTMVFRTIESQPWAPAAHVVARHQIEVGRADGPPQAPAPLPATAPPSAAPSTPAPVRAAVVLDDLEPTFALWRAPIDNETFGPAHATRWERLDLRHGAGLVLRTEVVPTNDGDAAVRVVHEVELPAELDDIPRVGVRLRLGPGVRVVEWLGRGPHECYSDRQVSAVVGRWRTDVDSWRVPYVHPQASGNRRAVRWLRFFDATGSVVLTIDELDELQVTVARVTDEELAAAGHLEDLPVRDDCFVWLDAAHRGVGSGAVGPDTAPDHRVSPGPYRWSYRLR